MARTQAEIDADNAQRSATEVASFATATHERYFAYLSSDGKRVTTWMGDTLAEVIWSGTMYRDNFGGQRTPFNAKGIDGREWYGRHNGPGMYLRMRPRKAR